LTQKSENGHVEVLALKILKPEDTAEYPPDTAAPDETCPTVPSQETL